jgi:hypothetical protein
MGRATVRAARAARKAGVAEWRPREPDRLGARDRAASGAQAEGPGHEARA